MFNLEDCLAFTTSQSAKIFAAAMEKTLRPYHVTRTQWIALYHIYTSSSITQKELAEKMTVKEPTVVRMIQKMETDGLLYRYGSDADKRIKYLKLTEAGTDLHLKLLPVAEKFKNDVISDIPDEDLQILKKTLQIMIDNAEKKVSRTR